MTAIPKPTIEQAIQDLRERDSYKVLIGFLRAEREAMFSQFGPISDPTEIIKLAARIGNLDEVISLMDQ
jgi:hypothetical protein